MTHEEQIAKLTEMLEIQQKLHETAIDMLKPAIEIAVQKEREVVANWIMDRGFATGHGDSIVDLLDQLEWQIAEKEREACAKMCETGLPIATSLSALDDMEMWGEKFAVAIRARGQA
jgi:hypothetical protein